MGRPKTTPDGRVNTGCRFDPDLHAALQVAASDREVSFNWIVNRLCREGLERLIPVDEMRLTQSPTERAS